MPATSNHAHISQSGFHQDGGTEGGRWGPAGQRVSEFRWQAPFRRNALNRDQRRVGQQIPGLTVTSRGRFQTLGVTQPDLSDSMTSLSADLGPGCMTNCSNAFRDAAVEGPEPPTTRSCRGCGNTIRCFRTGRTGDRVRNCLTMTTPYVQRLPNSVAWRSRCARPMALRPGLTTGLPFRLAS